MTVADIIALSASNFKNINATVEEKYNFIRLGMMELGRDTRDWIDGEIITHTTDTYKYTLTGNPIVIAGAFNITTGMEYVEGSVQNNGYRMLNPTDIWFNYITAGDTVQVNYYTYEVLPAYTDDNTANAETINISPALVNALSYFMLHKAILTYKDQSGLIQTNDYRQKYMQAVKEYNATRPDRNFQVIQTDLIKTKGYV